MNPIDVIAQVMRIADGGHKMGTGAVAEVAANALVDSRIVAHAALALRDDSGEADLPGVIRALPAHDRRQVALVVLRSVGEA